MIARLWSSILGLIRTEIQQNEEKEVPREVERIIPLIGPIVEAKEIHKGYVRKEREEGDILEEENIIKECSMQVEEPTNEEREEDEGEAVIWEMRELTKTLTECEMMAARIHSFKTVLDLSELQEPFTKRRTVEEHEALYKEYERDILSARELKYSLQLVDYPQLRYEEYVRVRDIWTRKNGVLKQVSLNTLEGGNLTFRMLRLLSFGEWVNDEVMNGYLEMIEKNIVESKWKIMNSFFATTILNKTAPQIEKVLEKKGVKQKHSLLIPINCNNTHWIFASLSDNTLTVYDSMASRTEAHCLNTTEVQKIMRFAQWFYAPHIEKCIAEFPSQTNSYDCGIFVLQGIKDVVRGKEWTFLQKEIPFKRVLMTLEFINEHVYGFE